MGVMLAGATFVYKASMLYNVLRQRYPVTVWARLNRISDVVRCPPKKTGKRPTTEVCSKDRAGGPKQDPGP